MVTDKEVGQTMQKRDVEGAALLRSFAPDAASYELGRMDGHIEAGRRTMLAQLAQMIADPNVDGPGMTDEQAAAVFEDILSMVEAAGPVTQLMGKALATRVVSGLAQRLWARAQVLPYSINVTFARMAVMLGQTDTDFVIEIRDWAIANDYTKVLSIVRLFRPDLLAKGPEAPPA